jgi:hypothetical protein
MEEDANGARPARVAAAAVLALLALFLLCGRPPEGAGQGRAVIGSQSVANARAPEQQEAVAEGAPEGEGQQAQAAQGEFVQAVAQQYLRQRPADEVSLRTEVAAPQNRTAGMSWELDRSPGGRVGGQSAGEASSQRTNITGSLARQSIASQAVMNSNVGPGGGEPT